MRLETMVAIVTGGGKGIGRHYVEGLAAQGAAVVIAEIDGKAADNLAAELNARERSDPRDALLGDRCSKWGNGFSCLSRRWGVRSCSRDVNSVTHFGRLFANSGTMERPLRTLW